MPTPLNKEKDPDISYIVSVMNKIKKFLMDVQFEMNKVSWPNWDELRGSTYVVLSLSLIFTVFLFFVDFFLSKILNIHVKG